MATRRRRIPMVGDSPVVVQVEEPRLEVHLRAEVSSSEEAKEFDWGAWSGLMIACLIVPRSTDALVGYWKSNANMLDWAKKVKPEIYEKVRLAFSERKVKLQGGQDG
jgi:hypothetical protein